MMRALCVCNTSVKLESTACRSTEASNTLREKHIYIYIYIYIYIHTYIYTHAAIQVHVHVQILGWGSSQEFAGALQGWLPRVCRGRASPALKIAREARSSYGRLYPGCPCAPKKGGLAHLARGASSSLEIHPLRALSGDRVGMYVPLSPSRRRLGEIRALKIQRLAMRRHRVSTPGLGQRPAAALPLGQAPLEACRRRLPDYSLPHSRVPHSPKAA